MTVGTTARRETAPDLRDLTAALDREEAIMEPMMVADPPDAAKLRTQIDRVAQARAELEKANANMLLGIRMVCSAGLLSQGTAVSVTHRW